MQSRIVGLVAIVCLVALTSGVEWQPGCPELNCPEPWCKYPHDYGFGNVSAGLHAWGGDFSFELKVLLTHSQSIYLFPLHSDSICKRPKNDENSIFVGIHR